MPLRVSESLNTTHDRILHTLDCDSCALTAPARAAAKMTGLKSIANESAGGGLSDEEIIEVESFYRTLSSVQEQLISDPQHRGDHRTRHTYVCLLQADFVIM